jgi:ubiquinone/menaquinone biosynthesis C-methylase UbiE
VSTWQRALYYWDKVVPGSGEGLRAIDLGARDGGLSLWLAQKGYSVVCSDVEGPSPLASQLHERYGVTGQVQYEAVDATAINAAGNSFDVVVFKSMLGGIGFYCNFAAIEQAMQEIKRVLKPGGTLLFAENLQASAFHRFARRHFVPWGKDWYYPSLAELQQLMSVFARQNIYSYGYFGCVKKDFAPFVLADKLICKKPLSANYYMAFGSAKI